MAETPIDRINPANSSDIRLVTFALMQQVILLRDEIESDGAVASAALTAAAAVATAGALAMTTAATDLNGVVGAETVVTNLGTAATAATSGATAATDAATAVDAAVASGLVDIDAELAKLRAVMPR